MSLGRYTAIVLALVSGTLGLVWAASDLEARAALYADGDPNNDPPPTGIDRSCVYCHAKAPEP